MLTVLLRIVLRLLVAFVTYVWNLMEKRKDFVERTPGVTSDLQVENLSHRSRSLSQLLLLRAQVTPNLVSYWEKVDGKWKSTTWREFMDEAAHLAQSFVQIGLKKGDKVSIGGPTRSKVKISLFLIIFL